jgi:hypothetical protein
MDEEISTFLPTCIILIYKVDVVIMCFHRVKFEKMHNTYQNSLKVSIQYLSPVLEMT